MTLGICLDCKDTFNKASMVRGRCVDCEMVREINRGTPSARGYNAEYQRNKAKLFREDDNSCVFCGSRNNLTADHIIPLAQGGTNRIENLQIACLKCNSSKREANKPKNIWLGRA